MAEVSESRLTTADIGVLVSYFVLVICTGMFAMYRAKRTTVGGYFLAGRSLWFLPVGASLFVSNIGSDQFIGLAGSGAASGISAGAWELNAVLVLQLLGWVFLPVYIASGVYTMPEYLARRFGGSRLRVYYAILSLILTVFIKLSSDLYTGALFIQQSLRWDLYVSISTLVLITAVLTITGGLTAVIYNDTLHTILMLGGSLYLMGAGFHEIGGFSGLLEKYPQAVPTNVSAIVPGTTCHHPDPQSFRMLRGVSDNYMPWLGFLLGQTPGTIWNWCTDQIIVQRALAAKSLSHAQGATVLAGFIHILPLFVLVMPGMMSRILYPDEVACTNPEYCMSVCQSRAGCSSIAYPRLVMGLMPNGARGLMMAVIVAALMSDLESLFNGSSSLFTIDIWKKFRRRATVTEQMIVGRLFIVAMVAGAIAWVPVVKETPSGQVYVYIMEVSNYFAPPFAAVFLLAVLVPKVNEKGAFWSLMYGFVVGVIRFVLVSIFEDEGGCGEDDDDSSLPVVNGNFHYMYFALSAFASTGVLALVISFLTEPPPKRCLERTTLWSCYNRPRGDGAMSEDTDSALKSLKSSYTAEVSKDSDNPDVLLTVADGAGTENGDTSVAVSARHPPSRIRRVINFLLGISYHSDDDATNKAFRDHLATLSALKQTKIEKILLTTCLVVILIIGVSLFSFWSVYNFRTAPFYPNGAKNLLPGDEMFISGNVTDYKLTNTTLQNNFNLTMV